MTRFTPTCEDEIADILRACASRSEAVEVLGRGSKRGWGRPVAAEHTVELSGMSGVTLYEPNELVLSARAGTSLAEIERLLDSEGQFLAFEPMNAGPLFGAPPAGGTIGGVLAGNLSGPRRIKAGAARDHALGIRAVSGAGTAFKSGGRVVKNVTGYDLSRGIAGSWGTLAVITELTFKVLPKPQGSRTVVVHGLGDRAAVDLLCAAMGSPWEISGAAHLPAGLARDMVGDTAATLLRLEGFAPSVAYRAEKLAEIFGAGVAFSAIDDPQSAALWRFVRDVQCFAPGGHPHRPLWRASVAPTAGPDLVAALRGLDLRYFYDWSGGLVWIEVSLETQGADMIRVRTAAEQLGGHATLVRRGGADEDIPAFQPQPAGLAALASRLKKSFDPAGILNPGRMG